MPIMEGAVPRSFFNIHNGPEVTPDTDGVDLPNLAATRRGAMQVLPVIAAHEVPADGDHQHYAVVVTDEDGLCTPLR